MGRDDLQPRGSSAYAESCNLLVHLHRTSQHKKQEQEFACLNKSGSQGQALSRSQLIRMAGAQRAYVIPINQGRGLTCRIRSWDRSHEVKDQEQQMDSKTLGLSFTSEHEEPESG